jgi:Rrf2 family protein
MNLALSKRGDYVVRSAICLARAHGSGEPKKLRQVSAEMGVPRTFVSQILGDLLHAGLAVSFFGKDGGYRLARPPAEVSLLEIVEAGEGTLDPPRCALGWVPCRWEDVCPLHETLGRGRESLRAVLAATSLAELAERDQAIEAGTYPVPADAHRRAARTVPAADTVQVEPEAPEGPARPGPGRFRTSLEEPTSRRNWAAAGLSRQAQFRSGALAGSMSEQAVAPGSIGIEGNGVGVRQGPRFRPGGFST